MGRTRIKEVSNIGFKVKIFGCLVDDFKHDNETIGYIAFE